MASEIAGEGEQFAFVELMGHRNHWGRISEQDQFGVKLMRVDVPGDEGFDGPFVTHFYGGSAIFSITPTTREEVERRNRSRPAPGGYLPSPVGDGGDDWIDD